MLNLILLALVSSVHAYTFQAKDVLNQKSVSFPAAKAKASVVLFLSAQCPCSASHEKTIKDLSEKYSKDGFEFVAIHSNQNETVEATKSHFKDAGFSFPVLDDHGAKIANELKALKTPHAFIIQNNKIVYEGGVDDSADAAEAKTPYLANALAEIKDNKPVTVAKARALGCQIKR